MSSSSASSSPGSSSLTDTSSSENDFTGVAQYYNYFFLLLGLAFLVLFLLLLYFQRRRKLNNARLQQHGRAALVRDVSLFAPAAGFWSWWGPSDSSRRLHRMRSAYEISILEAGLDERGEAPPPYKTAAAAIGKPPAILRAGTIQSPEGEASAMQPAPGVQRIAAGALPPSYSEHASSGEGLVMPARPPMVVTVMERVPDMDLQEQRR